MGNRDNIPAEVRRMKTSDLVDQYVWLMRIRDMAGLLPSQRRELADFAAELNARIPPREVEP